MSDANFLLLATRWRTRAEEILAQAEAGTDADARQEMRETAIEKRLPIILLS